MDINQFTYNKSNPLRCFFAFEGYNSQGLALNRIKRDYPDFDWICVGRSEIDPNAIKAANALFPENIDKNFGDISEIDWDGVPDFDLFTYSFPCQDISNAGRQHGFAEGSGSRSSLLWECEKAIRAKRPRWLLMENVKALVQEKFKPDFYRWVNRLSDYGYASYWEVLNAKDYGVPQNRERVFMVSILRTADDPAPAYNFPAPFTLTKCVEDYMIPAEDVPEDYFIGQERITDKVLSDILDQKYVFMGMEKLYHEEWKEALSR